MNIFGIGGTELIFILLIMLIVAGPKRMIRWAYILGQYGAKLQGMWAEAVAVMQKEIDEAGVDIKLPKEPPTRQDINRWAASTLKPISQPIESTMRSIAQPMKIDKSSHIPSEVQPSTSLDSSAAHLATSNGHDAASLSKAELQDKTGSTWSNPDVHLNSQQELPS